MVSTSELVSTRQNSVPSMSPDTTSEEDCVGAWFQTEAIVHNECTCWSGIDGAQLTTCVRHDHTANVDLQPAMKTTHGMNVNHLKQLPHHLPNCCAIGDDTVESEITVIESSDVDAQCNCRAPQESCRESEFISNVGQYSRRRNMDKDRSHTAFTDDCLRLPEEIGKLPYDISYDMDYDKLNMETQPVLHDDIYRSDSVMRYKSDFESTQNDSGVLEDSSPSVKAVDQSENSTSDLDLTDVVPDRCLFDVTAEGQGHGSEATCRSAAELVQVKNVADKDHVTDESYISSDAVKIPAETPAGESETDGHENESVTSEEKSPGMKHEGRKGVTVGDESESAKTRVEIRQGSHDSEAVVGVKHEAMIGVDVESESEHCSKRESGNDVVSSRGEQEYESTHEATHEAMITDATTNNEHANKTESGNVASRNQDDVKHNVVIMLDIETESRLACKTASDDVVDSSTHGEVKVSVALDVETESGHACKATGETDIKTESEHACKATSETDVKTESEHACRATESELVRLEIVHDEINSDKQVVQTENKGALVKCVQSGLHVFVDETHKEKDVDDVICAKHSCDETQKSISVEQDGDYDTVVTSSGPCPCVTHGDTAKRICETDDTCPFGDNDKSPSEISPGDNHADADAERVDNSDTGVSRSRQPIADEEDRLQRDILPDNVETIDSCDLGPSHGDSDKRCVGETETETEMCCPSVLHGGKIDTLTEAVDNQVKDGDTARPSDVVSPPDVQSDRPLREMVNVDLFVQVHSDLMLLLLMEDGVATHEEMVTDLVRA